MQFCVVAVALAFLAKIAVGGFIEECFTTTLSPPAVITTWSVVTYTTVVTTSTTIVVPTVTTLTTETESPSVFTITTPTQIVRCTSIFVPPPVPPPPVPKGGPSPI